MHALKQDKPEYYYEFLNTDLISRIPLDVKRVLDVGCGAGILGRTVLGQRPNLEWWGIETVSLIAEKARDNLFRVMEGDIETLILTEEEHGLFDCLIYSDLLEHLYDPWSVLKSHLKVLKPKGYVLCSIPNIQNWSIIMNLVRGDWPYASEGILDNDHVRFFTLKTAQQLFLSEGLEILDVFGRVYGVEEQTYQHFSQLIKPLVDAAGEDFVRFQQQALPVQWVILSQKP